MGGESSESFGSTGYSRAAYEKAEKNEEEALRKFGEGVVGGAMTRGLGNLIHLRMLEGAERKLSELKEKGTAEAMEINEEYDRLMQEVQKANEALKIFMRDKLGMQEDSAE